MRIAAVTVLVLTLAGCGSGAVVETAGTDPTNSTADTSAPASASAPLPEPYSGPLYVQVTDASNSDVRIRAGAAVLALECSAGPYLGESTGSYREDKSAADALTNFLKQPGFRLPQRGYRIEREEPERMLYSYDVAGKTKVAIIASDAVPKPGFPPGWNIESFAMCDHAEFDDAVTDEVGVQVWTDRDGVRVPTTVVQSSLGPEHCHWESATFLNLGREQFIRDPAGALAHTSFRVTFESDSAVPADATDTGYRLDGQELWLAADRSAAYVVLGAKVERWPAPTEQVGCA